MLWRGFVVDEEQRTVAPYDPGCELTVDHAEGTTLRFDGKVLYHSVAADYDVRPLLSRSRTHLAYFRRSQDGTSSAIHVAVKDGDQFIIPGLCHSTHLVAWIEGPGSSPSHQTATTLGY